MNIKGIIESRERCAESGWYAYDFLLDTGMNAEFIRSLRGIGGSFLFLSSLKKPFFKIESDHYMIKGVQDNDFFRMAVHEDYTEEVDRVKKFITGMTI